MGKASECQKSTFVESVNYSLRITAHRLGPRCCGSTRRRSIPFQGLYTTLRTEGWLFLSFFPGAPPPSPLLPPLPALALAVPKELQSERQAQQKRGDPAICTTWMALQSILLSEMSQTQEDKYCVISFLLKFLKAKRIQTESERVVAGGRRVGEMGEVTNFQL